MNHIPGCCRYVYPDTDDVCNEPLFDKQVEKGETYCHRHRAQVGEGNWREQVRAVQNETDAARERMHARAEEKEHDAAVQSATKKARYLEDVVVDTSRMFAFREQVEWAFNALAWGKKWQEHMGKAPGPGAYAMLRWAQNSEENRREFMFVFAPKIMKGELTASEEKFTDDGSELVELCDLLASEALRLGVPLHGAFFSVPDGICPACGRGGSTHGQ